MLCRLTEVHLKAVGALATSKPSTYTGSYSLQNQERCMRLHSLQMRGMPACGLITAFVCMLPRTSHAQQLLDQGALVLFRVAASCSCLEAVSEAGQHAGRGPGQALQHLCTQGLDVILTSRRLQPSSGPGQALQPLCTCGLIACMAPVGACHRRGDTCRVSGW